jgi:predicted TIM-barrel fold metal-dependent hydrolase
MKQGFYKGEPRLAEQDEDGVDAEVIFSSGRMLGHFFRMRDDDALEAAIQALNNWILQEFVRSDPNRLIGLAYVPAIGAERAARELERVRKMGAKGAVLVCWPSGNDQLSSAEDPFWAKAEELSIPIHIHVRLTPRFTPAPKATGQQGGDIPGLATTGMLDMPKHMGQLIIAGVFDRFPGLKMVGVEAGCGWIPYVLEQLDDRYWRNRKWANCNLKMQPSDYYHRNWHSTFMKDSYAFENRHRIGVENMMWSSDYPHHGCEWPYSRKQIRETAVGVPADELQKILAGNAVELYGLQ